MSSPTPAIAALPNLLPSPEEHICYRYFVRFNPHEYYYVEHTPETLSEMFHKIFNLLFPNMRRLRDQRLIDSRIGAYIHGFLTRWHDTLPPRLRVLGWNQLIARVPTETWPSHGLPCLTVGLPFPGEPSFVMTSPPLPLIHYLLQQEVLESEDILCTPLIDEEAFPGVVFPWYPTPLPDDVDELASEQGSPIPQPCRRCGAQPSAPVTSNFSPLSNGQTLTLALALPFSPCPAGPPAGPSTPAPPRTPAPRLPSTPAPPPYRLPMPPLSHPPPAFESQPPAVHHSHHHLVASIHDLQQTLRVPASTPGTALPSAATFLDLNHRVTASLPVPPTPPTPDPRRQPQPQSPLPPDSRLPQPGFSSFSTPVRPAPHTVMLGRTPQCRPHAQVSPPLPPVVGDGEFSTVPVPSALRGTDSTLQPQEPLFFPSSEEDDGHRPPSRSPPPPSDFGGAGDLFDDIPVIEEAWAPLPELVYDAVSGDLIANHDFDMGSPVVEVPKCTTHSKGKGKAGASPSKRKKPVRKTKAPPATPPQAEESVRSPPPFVRVCTSTLHHTIASPSPMPAAGPSHLAKCKKPLQAARASPPPVEASPHVPLTRSRAAATRAAILPPVIELPEESESGSDDDAPPKKKRRISNTKQEKKKQVSCEKGKAKNEPGAGSGVAIGCHSTSRSELEALTFEDIHEGPAAFFKPIQYSDKNGTFGARSDPFPYFAWVPDVSGDCIPCSTRDLNCTWTNQFPGASCDQCTCSHHGRCSARYTTQEMNKVSSKLAKYVRYNVGSMESDLKELHALNHDLEHLDVLMRHNFLRHDHLIQQLADSLDQIAGHENGNAIIEGLASAYEEVSSFIINDGIRRSLSRPLNLPKPGESSRSAAGSKSKSPIKGDESEEDLDPSGSSASSSGSSSSSD
ncbi:uncharacterized protein EV420DRAFT_1646981 [Desarmillaria tabescens]|uniref:Uncharacterized protein n=1 Tax=Armillaria tabescens TaxID=1929756 RepID=A0AA39JZV4_ARMTA|nr:uncharacterized protein EV420DRAFT_1646981 [Desarmillaria tabescens]KAK0449653.1 hypothetical protein EV420DRAFT_1646981 [Desarmillaria tabescens]